MGPTTSKQSLLTASHWQVAALCTETWLALLRGPLRGALVYDFETSPLGEEAEEDGSRRERGATEDVPPSDAAREAPASEGAARGDGAGKAQVEET